MLVESLKILSLVAKVELVDDEHCWGDSRSEYSEIMEERPRIVLEQMNFDSAVHHHWVMIWIVAKKYIILGVQIFGCYL